MTNFFIDEHGCAKNQVDAEIIISRLLSLGMQQTFDASKANIIIVNSCGFINSAKKESIDAVISAKKLYPNAKILLTGCLAERYSETLKESLSEVDGIFGNGDLTKIDTVIKPLVSGNRPVLTPEQKGVCVGERKVMLSFHNSAYVKITEGCSNHCTFCAIPIIRGELRSRKAAEIVKEIKSLIKNGIYEINLIGQDLAAYGTGEDDNVFGTGQFLLPTISEKGENKGTKDESALSKLLKNISQIKGDFIIRLLYIHPDHFNRDILATMKSDSRFVPYFDIPFQSGDDTIIFAMNRKGTQKEYTKLIRDIRKVFPDAAVRTTFLTGFPGETEENAKNTQMFLSKIKSDWSGCFTYSKEEDTPAFNMKNKVSKKIATERATALQNIQSKITQEKLATRCGKEYDVLIEEVIKSESDDCFAIARAWFQAPEVDGSFVVHYNIEEQKYIASGNVVRVYADSVSGVDIYSHFLSASKTYKNRNKKSLLFASDFYEKE